MLSRLSYGPEVLLMVLVLMIPARIERATFRVSGGRSPAELQDHGRGGGADGVCDVMRMNVPVVRVELTASASKVRRSAS